MSVDLQRQLDTATAFFLAGERCALEAKFGPYGLHVISAPTITNYAFAVELALKILHFVTHQKTIGGHGLEKLFRSLPDDVRANLMYLEDCVSEIDQYFVDWRYPYEREYLEGEFDNPRRSFIHCYREIRRLQPQLVSVYEKDWGQFEPDLYHVWGTNAVLEIREQWQG